MTKFASEVPDCRVCAAIRDCKFSILLVGIFSFCENLLVLAVPLYMLQLYDRVLTSNSKETLISLTFVVVGALFALSVVSHARARVLSAAADWLERRLSPGLFERAIQSRLKGSKYGPEALDDLGAIRGFATSPGMASFFDLPWTIVFITISYILHPWFGHLAVLAGVLLMAVALAGEFMARAPVLLANEAAMIARRQLDATVRNAEVIEAMGMIGSVRGKWSEINEKKLELHADAQNVGATFNAMTKFIRLAAQTLTLGMGAWLVLGLEATGGVMIAASIILTRALAPIEQAIASWRSVVASRGALLRLKAFALEHEYRPSMMPLPAPSGRIDVEQLIYRLVDSHTAPILKGVGFNVDAGESLAIIGPSGAGKTTLARLLVGAVPPFSGVVRLDGADVFSWDRDQIGAYVGYLPQDIELFAGSVAENIARLMDVDSEKVVAAAMMAGVHDMILRLPKGYETQIGPDGQHLSGGQRQRVALARAMYGPPKMVVLDEPNSNLDGEGDHALEQAIKSMKAAGVTVIVITHKINLVQSVDKILMLRDGLVERFGPAREILARMMGPRAAPVVTSVSNTAAKVESSESAD